MNDLQSVMVELNKLNATQTVLRLTLHGSLTEEELQECRAQITEATKSLLHCDSYWNIGFKITSEAINKLFAKDRIPHILLTKLSQNKEDALAMQLAYQTIKIFPNDASLYSPASVCRYS